MMSELGKIPKEGDTVIYQNYKFVVEAMERFRIQMVRIQSFKQHNKEPDLQ
jgi:CBS domain containing-hemolysin-like protein